MKKTDLVDYATYIVTEYYKNNITPFLNAFSENCIWIGPTEGQMIHSKKALLEAFSMEETPLTFEMRDLVVYPVPVSRCSMDTILTYTIITYYPNGYANIFKQRTELLWVEEAATDESGKRTKDFFIRVCHISNEFQYSKSDRIYPNHFEELDIARLYSNTPDNSNKITLKGLHNSFLQLSAESIMWMMCKAGHTIVHTTTNEYESVEQLASIVKRYPDLALRIHSSHAVNPTYVSEIGRFYVIMSDGKKLSIPEKKYTKTRDEIHRWIEENSKR